MHHFTLEGQYKELLAHYGLDAGAVLRKAQLPEDILNHKTIVMKEAEYYRFLTAIGSLADNPALPVKMAREVQPERPRLPQAAGTLQAAHRPDDV